MVAMNVGKLIPVMALMMTQQVSASGMVLVFASRLVQWLGYRLVRLCVGLVVSKLLPVMGFIGNVRC